MGVGPASAPPSEDAVVPGRYRHYKGPEYEVLSEARHSETEEVLVVYRALYGERGLWVRPKAMFVETVVVDGVTVPRFARVGDA
ncbi:DUF1653 domain-containing protein [Patulibacter sp. NPDC049589]|uniref:DUF1653 domain-containing protein n=1 Tax=Patulibacter sp. NPDC049589 TaxID=3154731 RepID=UPI003422EC4C